MELNGLTQTQTSILSLSPRRSAELLLSPHGPEEEPPTLSSRGRGLPSQSLISAKAQGVVQARVGAGKAALSQQRRPASPWPTRGPGRLLQPLRSRLPWPPGHTQGQGGRLLPGALPGASGAAPVGPLQLCARCLAGPLVSALTSSAPAWVGVVASRTRLTAGHGPWRLSEAPSRTVTQFSRGSPEPWATGRWPCWDPRGSRGCGARAQEAARQEGAARTEGHRLACFS